MLDNKTMNKVMNKSFLKLIADNPELPIIPMVDYEIVGEDWGRWMGSFGDAYVGEYVCYHERYYEDREEFKESYFDWNSDKLCEQFNYEPSINEFTVKHGRYTKEQLEVNDKNEKLLEEYLDKLAEEYFTKAIIVYIDLP